MIKANMVTVLVSFLFLLFSSAAISETLYDDFSAPELDTAKEE